MQIQPQETVVRYERAISEKKRSIALVLCIFLGPLGIHRFYVGKMGSGIIYLFTLGIFGLGWIFDIIQILLGNWTDNLGSIIRNW